MSGSLTWREYESDCGQFYSIQVDKSNASLIGAVSQQPLCKIRTSLLKIPPKSLALRRIHCYSQQFPKIKRHFIVGNRSVISNTAIEYGGEYLVSPTFTNSTYTGTVWIITGYSGESFTPPVFYYQTDTGLDDGTPFER